MADDRGQKRFIKRLNTEFSVDRVTRKGISSNLSINGLFIRTNYPYIPDTLLDIVIHFPDGNVSKIKGRVRRSSKTSLGRIMGATVKSLKNGMGIKIVESDANYLHLIRDLIS